LYTLLLIKRLKLGDFFGAHMSVALEHVSIFQDCDETTLKNLATYLQLVEFKKGAFIVRHGDLAKEMFFISSGSVCRPIVPEDLTVAGRDH
jgi:hypothetical protein